MLGAMERVPKLADYEKFCSGADALVKSAFDALTNLDLVAVIAGAVQKSVTILDSVVDDIGADVLGQLPEAETELGELVAAGKGQVLHSSLR